MDMMARAKTMPRAKPAIWLQRSSERQLHCIRISGVWGLSVELELESLLHELLHFLAPHTSAG